MAKNIVVLGSQWGDEGKGKIVDWLAPSADVVVRFQGGHNAGHTLVVNGKKTALNLIPSGALHTDKLCVIGNGVVVSVDVLLKEIAMLAKQGVDLQGRLLVSENCPLLLPTHVALDQAREKKLGKEAIGTTGRGIGPAYEDKIARRGLRLVDLFDSTSFAQRLKTLVEYHNFLLVNYYQVEPIDFEPMLKELLEQSSLIKPLIADVTALLHEYRLQGKKILFEGAQGALLDIDLGTYPFVTSSNTTAGGVATGTGFGPGYLDEIVGVVKAYTTRVGSGPMPCELHDSDGKIIAQQGLEFGTVTGRPRRCGWFDLPMMRKSVQINSLTGLCLTKLDVLDIFATLKICTHYQLGGKKLMMPPSNANLLAQCLPIYEQVPGWKSQTVGVTNYKQLPAQAQAYVQKISDYLAVPIYLISTGAERKDTIILHNLFK